ncbi:MAG: type II secretion system F family protein [Planctomycetota bacterium]
MKTFTYRSKNVQGKLVTGSIEAETEADAVAELRRRGLTVTQLSQGRGGSASSGRSSFFAFTRPRKKGNRRSRGNVRSSELVVVSRQLATMVAAGIPLVEGMEVLEEQTQSQTMKRVLGEVVSDVRSGKDLSQALARHPKVFNDIYVHMVRAGEASGQIDIVLARLADYQEDVETLKSEIRSAMTYPVVSLILVLGITLFLLVGIIPKFEEMFLSLKVDLPWITKTLLAVSRVMKAHVLMGLTLVFAGCMALALYVKTDQGRFVKDWVILKLPIFGGLFSKVAISRFSRTFATLIRSGVPILGSLEIVQNTTGNLVYCNAINTASESVRQGETLGEPLGRTGIFPLMVTRMISIGERTGALESLLEKISQFYDQQVRATVKALTSLIEPIMIAIMGFLVGGMVAAIFLPIFKMIGTLGR